MRESTAHPCALTGFKTKPAMPMNKAHHFARACLLSLFAWTVHASVLAADQDAVTSSWEGHTSLYFRQREAVDGTGDIDLQSWGQRLSGTWSDRSSGVGLEVSLQSNVRLGHGKGWSEVLYHDLVAQRDRSQAQLGALALHWQGQGQWQPWDVRLGLTPLQAGSLGTSGGLHSHAYRGMQVAHQRGDWRLAYAWADRFRNEWDDRFREITNSWTQGRLPGVMGVRRLSYVHSFGIQYTGSERDTWDVGVGQGLDYRHNAHVFWQRRWTEQEDAKWVTQWYTQMARYQAALSGIAAPQREWHTGFGLQRKTKSWTASLGIAHTHAPDSREMNLRLSAWANSDARHFIQTAGQLDDFLWHGTTAIKAGLQWQWPDLPGWQSSVAVISGHGLTQADGQQRHAQAYDLGMSYTFKEGPFRRATVGLYPAWYRSHGFTGKSSRRDCKLFVSWPLND